MHSPTVHFYLQAQPAAVNTPEFGSKHYSLNFDLCSVHSLTYLVDFIIFDMW